MQRPISFELQQVKVQLYAHVKLPATRRGKQSLQGGMKEVLRASLAPIQKFLWGNKEGELMLGNVGVQQVEINVHLCGNRRMRTLNRQYRDKDKTTDVLSFPVWETLRPLLREKDQFGPSQISLGDIFISREVALQQAKVHQIRFAEEFLHLFVHGFLHLCGFDHEKSQKEAKTMFSLEEKLVNKIYKSLK